MGSGDSIRLALFGESNVGKSHYGAQLLSHIEADRCALKLRHSPSDLSMFDEVRRCLNSGLSAGHTPAGVYREAEWPVVYAEDKQFDLIWPDYAGEQVSQLIETRRFGLEWLERTQDASGWILMVRPKRLSSGDDIFSKPLGDLRKTQESAESKIERSIQAKLVELLQLLLHARGMHGRRDIPPLAVLLSCWDELELPTGSLPSDVLAQSLPLLCSFVQARWGSRSLVCGVSALGTVLRSEVPNMDFVDRGPEWFGHVVTPEGIDVRDLTYPIVALAEMVRA